MKKTAAYVLLLVAAAPLRLAAHTPEAAQSVETADQCPAMRLSPTGKQNRTFPSIPSSMVLGKEVKFENYKV
jgi:hypothetical protein